MKNVYLFRRRLCSSPSSFLIFKPQSTSAIDKFTYFCTVIASRSCSIISSLEVSFMMVHECGTHCCSCCYRYSLFGIDALVICCNEYFLEIRIKHQISIWISAIRPKTLAAGIVPVLVGASAAYQTGAWNPSVFGVALFCSIAIQVLTNFVNDLFDARKGADTDQRQGPKRAVASGLISDRTMTMVSMGLTACIFLCGLYLVYSGGIPILLIGIVSLIFAWLYTAGPYPLSYLGLGDVFVFIFFGIVATCGTYFLFTHECPWVIYLVAAIPGLSSVTILMANNIRDIDTDRLVHKNTTAVRFGKAVSIRLFTAVMLGIYLSALGLFLVYSFDFRFLLTLLSLPVALSIIKKIYAAERGEEYNTILANCGKLLFINGILLSLSFLL